MDSLVRKSFLWMKHHEIVPQWAYRSILNHTNLLEVRKAIWMAGDPYRSLPLVSSNRPKYPYTIGIVKEFCNKHLPHVAACRDLGVSYRVIDISGPAWLEEVERSHCDAFLVPPCGLTSVWKQMFDERLRVMAHDLGKKMFPSCESMWFYESKRRMHYWLEANEVPHPKAWVFYDLKQALQFAGEAPLPIVYKSDFGSGASGVKIFRDRAALRRHVKRCFTKGYRAYTRCVIDREWGSVFLQEYLPDAKEWRMIRLGDSYFGHQKLKRNDFHSGSGRFAWCAPPEKLLDFMQSVTQKGGFKSMNLDVFETCDGRYLVNELQAFFGWIRPYQMVVDGKVGRYLYNHAARRWVFEEGVYCQHGGCNLRVASLMSELGVTIGLVGTSDLHLVSEEDRKTSQSGCPVGAGAYVLS
ncbi:MAG: hypothetical protein JW955_09870 [Sedimentisphaerales bacterium]|nr:hypothetical protein [Sedimentisphaerales bacterium]